MLGRRIAIAWVVAAATAVAAPPAQAATTRYAAPAAQGGDDCSSPANACPISAAVTMATTGDTIDVLGNLGTYNLAAGTISTGPKVLHFNGVNGTPRLIANASSSVLDMSGAASGSASNLYLENDGGGDGLFAGTIGGPSDFSLDRLFVKTTGSTLSHTCFIGGGVTLTNSVCFEANTSAGAAGVAAEGTDTLRNVTARVNGTGPGIDCGAAYSFACNLTVVNTIARATGGGSDLVAFSPGGMGDVATITARYSNFGTTARSGTTSMDQINTDATDQHPPPQLVDTSAGDFHELSTSPTINAGITDPANGAADLDGKPRVVNGKTDIGAYELGTPGVLTPPSGTRVTRRKVNKHTRRASLRFTASGEVSGFQCALARQKKGRHHRKLKLTFAPCKSPKTYRHLKRGRYIFEVRAFNASGVDPKPAIKHFKV